jgi:hypothetical protein
VIRGYPEQPSPVAGSSLVLHVATDAPEFRVEFHRCGARLTRCGGSGWLPGRDAPHHRADEDWGRPGVGLDGEPLEPWPAYRFDVPAGWPPGAYVAVLVEGDGSGRDRSDPDRTTPDGREAKALFVVRPPAPAARILYKLPLLTYHAYDMVDGERWSPATNRGTWCIYSDDMPEGTAMPPGVDVHRPGGGTGGTPFDLGNFDPFDPTPRQTFVHWDWRFLGWLERSGYAVDVCTDMDLHVHGPRLLDGHRLLVSAGHDEYWSDTMRAAVEGFVAGEGNLAFFSGNTVWWRVAFDGPTTFRRASRWSDPGTPGEPENTLLGASFRHGGERDRDERPVPVGYRVQHAGHWAYARTGLRDGDVVGERDYLVGYECDGAHFDRADLEAGRPVRPSGIDGTPPDFTILAVGDLRPSGWGFGNTAATMLVRDGSGGRGTVFNAATTDWARVLTAGTSPAVEQITRNVLDRLG